MWKGRVGAVLHAPNLRGDLVYPKPAELGPVMMGYGLELFSPTVFLLIRLWAFVMETGRK